MGQQALSENSKNKIPKILQSILATKLGKFSPN
jgi:hypothetical protein